MPYEVKITIPPTNTKERIYVLDFLFKEILGISYIIESDALVSDYVIEFHSKCVVIRDHFFSRYPEELTYLRQEALPVNVVFGHNPCTVETDIPIIYGDEEFSVSGDEIVCGIDIFASVYFMLTRWEEYVNPQLDTHGRFLARDSIAARFHFLHRPVVNEYIELLWNLFIYSSFPGKRKKREFQLHLTHDIDKLFYRKTKYIALLGDMLKRHDLKKAATRVEYLFVHNPYDTFNFLMTCSERRGVRSHFYFMASGRIKNVQDDSDYTASRKFKTIIAEIHDREHVIGFHPGYFTFQDEARWRDEKLLLEKQCGLQVREGRQHYLRFDISKTFLWWENNNMLLDSTLGFADQEGFRCGTGDEFPVFDFLRRVQLNLRERPLIIMDNTIQGKRCITPNEKEMIYKKYIDLCRKYETGLTLLFHNSSFDAIDWPGWKTLYENVLNY